MSNYTYADLFDKSASKKEITIETEDKSVKITNSEIHFEPCYGKTVPYQKADTERMWTSDGSI